MRWRFGAQFWGVALVALLAAAGGFALFAPGDGPPIRQVALGTERLNVPRGYLRPRSRAGGVLDRLDLAAFFPDFAPAGDVGDVAASTDLGERFQKLVFITIAPSDSSGDPADRPAKLYARFLEPDGWTHPGGLVAKAFQAGSPFEGEELYMVAPEGRLFAARCRRPQQTPKTPNSCAYDFRLGDLDVELRFSAALLSDWEKLNAGARGLIEATRR